MKPLLPILLLASFASFAQSGFYTRSIDFSNDSNARWEHPPIENLGTILLDAYLRGDLKAYKFAVAHDVRKYAPIPENELPASWNPGIDYYQGDMVAYNDKVYISNFDFASDSIPPDSSRHWQDMELHGPAVSMYHHFPTELDSTTKSFLLSRLIEEEPATYDTWVETYEYFNDDRVEWQGKKYSARRNNFLGIEPGTNEQFWEEIQSKLGMYEPQDLNIIDIIYHYEIKGGDTIHTPQMVSVKLLDKYTEAHRNIGLNFYYGDVLRYLERRSQPALYVSGLGNLDRGVFLFDDRTKLNFTRWIHSKILSKEIKPGKSSILSEAEYHLFINTKAEDLTGAAWYPVQNPDTHDFTIVAGKLTADYEYYRIATLLIPYKSIEKLLKTIPPTNNFKTYADIFTENFLISSIDTIAMDSIEAFPPTARSPVEYSDKFFHEIHFDNLDANPLIANTIPVLWKLIESAVASKALALQTRQSNHPCTYDWTNTLLEWGTGKKTVDGDFSISHLPPVPEMPQPHWKLKQVGVVYVISTVEKKAPVSSKNAKVYNFGVSQLVISFESEAHSDLINYRLNWGAVLKLIFEKSEYGDFIAAVHAATLNFKQSAIDYSYTFER